MTIMKDIRVSIRLTEDEHMQLKMIAIKKKTTIQSILHNFIEKELKKAGDTSEKD